MILLLRGDGQTRISNQTLRSLIEANKDRKRIQMNIQKRSISNFVLNST